VKAGSGEYLVYANECALNTIGNAVVLMSWPISEFGDSEMLSVFLSAGISLSAAEILELYSYRWNVEIFYKTIKNSLGVKGNMLRTKTGIKRHWAYIALAYNICVDIGGSYSQG